MLLSPGLADHKMHHQPHCSRRPPGLSGFKSSAIYSELDTYLGEARSPATTTATCHISSPHAYTEPIRTC